MAAPKAAIARLAGDAEVARRIAAARDAVLAGQREQIKRTRFDLRDKQLQAYLVGLFRGLSVERMHVFYVGSALHYLADESLESGSGTQIAPCKRALVARAIDFGANGIVLVHNHPSGIAAPSESDLHETRQLSLWLAGVDLTLVDHLIVAGTTICSMRREGMLR